MVTRGHPRPLSKQDRHQYRSHASLGSIERPWGRLLPELRHARRSVSPRETAAHREVNDMGLKILHSKSGEILLETIMRRYEIRSMMTSTAPLKNGANCSAMCPPPGYTRPFALREKRERYPVDRRIVSIGCRRRIDIHKRAKLTNEQNGPNDNFLGL
jgi:hypothetical protein